VRKILFIIPDLEYGGDAKQLLLLATHLPRALLTTRLVALGKPGPLVRSLQNAGLEIEALGWRLVLDLNPIRRLRRILHEFQPDVIHAWQWPSLRALWLAGNRLPGRVIASGLANIGESSRVQNWLDRWLLHTVDVLVAGGHLSAGQLGGLRSAAEKLILIPPAVEHVSDPAQQPGILKQTLGLPPTARLLLCVGPLERQKGFRDAIWGFHILKYLYEDLNLVLIGTGSDRARLEHFVPKGIKSVHFVGPQPDVPRLLSQGEVTWIPSLAPGGVNTSLEALSAGSAVVASALPCLAEIIVDGVTGFLFTPGDKVALARQTRRLLDDPELRRRMANAGRERVATHFPVLKMVEQHVRLYEA
jgi:glycosyltransferase involved in cell wall biosynthesis